jgi:hypothetical protein
MPNEEKLITLKEASALSGYSADYIGQLIRSGKIPGKQVFTNITWVTTAESVISYKERKNKHPKGSISGFYERLLFEFRVMALFFRTFRTAWPYLAFVAVFLSFSTYFLLDFFLAPKVAAENGMVAGVVESATENISY